MGADIGLCTLESWVSVKCVLVVGMRGRPCLFEMLPAHMFCVHCVARVLWCGCKELGSRPRKPQLHTRADPVRVTPHPFWEKSTGRKSVLGGNRQGGHPDVRETLSSDFHFIHRYALEVSREAPYFHHQRVRGGSSQVSPAFHPFSKGYIMLQHNFAE